MSWSTSVFPVVPWLPPCAAKRPMRTAAITTSAAKPHSRPMSCVFGLCLAPISGEETAPPGADAYQPVWPCGASGTRVPQTVQKRAPGFRRLPQCGQTPGIKEAAVSCRGGTDCAGSGRSGTGAPQLVQKRIPSSSGAPHCAHVRGVSEAFCAALPAGCCVGRQGCCEGSACSGSIAPQARQMTALSESCAPHFGQIMARPLFSICIWIYSL